MLQQVETIFDDMRKMMKRLKKASYQVNMENFTEKHGHYFKEMADYMEAAEDKDKAASELSETFISAVAGKYEVKGKVKATTQSDLNFFMIYYVFPSILKTESEYAKTLADELCAQWGNHFKDSRIGYADYDKLYNSFRDKIFGFI
jgi:hypothetical protein